MSAPSSTHVIRAIAHREIALAARRRLVRLLFLASVLPPLVLTVVIIVRMMAESMTGTRLDWDPVMHFLQFQSIPVALLALGIGAPAIARDRAEDVLFLYATRPVLPWHYALGKLLAVAVPAAALMLLPGLLIAILRVSVTAQLTVGAGIGLALKLTLVSVLTGWAYAGVAIGPSAATRRGRWAMLIALLVFILPDAIARLVWGWGALPLGPRTAVEELMEALVGGMDALGIMSIAVLLLYGALGGLVAVLRVRQEMIP